MPVDAEFNIDSNWVVLVQGVDRICITDFLVLDVEIEPEEFYCIDLTFDLREDEKVQRTCFRLKREAGTFRSTILEILGSV